MPIWHLCVRDLWESGANDPKNDGGWDFLPPASDSTTNFSLARCEVEQANQFPLYNLPLHNSGWRKPWQKVLFIFKQTSTPKNQLQGVNKPTIFQSHGLFSPYFEVFDATFFSFCLEIFQQDVKFLGQKKGATNSFVRLNPPKGVSDVIRTCNQTMKHLENGQQRKNAPPTRGH